MSIVIPPTVGRVVWVRFRPGSLDKEQPEAALVTYVHSDHLVNVAGYDANGQPFAITSLKLLQADDDIGAGQLRAEWMPYQKGQAAKTEQAERDRNVPPSFGPPRGHA